MYHPVASGTNDAEDFEFIELKNVGAQPLNLIGVSFTNGISFTFTATNAITNLGPGQYAGAGCQPGRLPLPLSDSHECRRPIHRQTRQRRRAPLPRKAPSRSPFSTSAYDDSWYPTTDGEGFSLVIRNEYAAFNTWTNPASWRASAALNGSPGRADGAAAHFPARRRSTRP